jgi:mannose-6-phosphate isomerase-like protein (cupin superfamily)
MEQIEHTNIADLVYERTFNLVKSIFKTPLAILPSQIQPLPEGFNYGGDDIRVTRLYECGKLVIVLGEFQADAMYPYHTHGISEEHFVCVYGKLEVTINQDESLDESFDEIKILSPSGCMTIPAGIQHKVRALEKSEVVAICIPPEIAYCKVNNGTR